MHAVFSSDSATPHRSVLHITSVQMRWLVGGRGEQYLPGPVARPGAGADYAVLVGGANGDGA
jgi:hypothetical protein